ncbi:hypothetical protein ACHQM5_001353 [Ranunculus cassubicifolius]
MEEQPPKLLPKPKNSLLNNLINLDTNLSLRIHQTFQPIPRSLLRLLEISGDGRFWVPIPIALFFSLSSKSDHLKTLFIGLFAGIILDLLLVGLIKFTIKRPRPVYNKGMHLTVAVDHWSFPSGHSSRVCFIGSYLYFSIESIVDAFGKLGDVGLGSEGRIVKYFVLVVCFWSMLTSMSRVLLGRHFVFDVIAGAFLGVLNALFVFRLMYNIG